MTAGRNILPDKKKTIEESEIGDIADDLPVGWVWITVSDLKGLSGFIKDGDWILSDDFKTGSDVRLIQLSDIGRGVFLDKSNRFISKRRAIELDCTFLEAGDLLVSRMAAPLARGCILPKLPYDCITAVDVTILRPDIKLASSKYACWMFNSEFIQKQAEALSSGTTRKRISRKNLELLKVPLPPRSEQRRIIAKIEELFTRLDAGVSSLKKVKAQLMRFRYSVLENGFNGRLTAEWRSEHEGQIEPASVLLQRIEKECTRGQTRKRREPNIFSTSDMATSNFPVNTAADYSERALPKGWEHSKLLDITEGVAKVNPKMDPEKTFIYLDIASIDNNQAKIVHPKEYRGFEAPSRARQLVLSGDILFSTVRTYLKNIAVVPDFYDGQVASTGFCVVRPCKGIDNKFIFYLMRTEDFLNPLNQQQRGTSYPAVRESDVLSQIIPVPPLEEQRCIVAKIEQLFSFAEATESAAAKSIEQAERMHSGILKQTFEGKLVPQDPNDEPASALLKYVHDIKTKRSTKVEGSRAPELKQMGLERYVK